jgi:hypothetical protein
MSMAMDEQVYLYTRGGEMDRDAAGGACMHLGTTTRGTYIRGEAHGDVARRAVARGYHVDAREGGALPDARRDLAASRGDG